ncbi:uncharacterized protein TNCV_3170961 [Trichonephila clavipes]|nr:uncharacterized protein TNCV_3170961 [Trichonephila clavipes]
MFLCNCAPLKYCEILSLVITPATFDTVRTPPTPPTRIKRPTATRESREKSVGNLRTGHIALYGLVESFFKNDEGHNVTVNGDRYRAMITNFFISELNHHDIQELWFQQDGATCHTARATIDLLKDTFGDRLISRFGPVNWPPRSCDLTPLDYFLWAM